MKTLYYIEDWFENSCGNDVCYWIYSFSFPNPQMMKIEITDEEYAHLTFLEHDGDHADDEVQKYISYLVTKYE